MPREKNMARTYFCKGREEDSFSIPYEMRGFHVYKKEWKPAFHQILYGSLEQDNPHDKNCVAFCQTPVAPTQSLKMEDRQKFSVVGHLPIELSATVAHFIRRGGTVTACVQDPTLHRSNRAQGISFRKFSSSK